VLIITNPIAGIVTQPMIEIQGFCTDPLASLTFDLTNAAGLFTNQQAFVLSQHYDTNAKGFTTNTFQAFDVPLTNGDNVVTFHATDMAGNITTSNFIYTLDYSGKTNPPAIQVYWPQNGDLVSGTEFTLRGSLDDFTASLTAQIVDSSGGTNTVQGLVERNGLFWVENVPLLAGTNYVTLTAMDAVSNISTTNLTINCVSGGLTIEDFSYELGESPPIVIPFVSGTVVLANYTIWVNGVQASQDGQGNWDAYSVPVGPGGTAVVEARAIPNSDNNGNGTGTAPSSYGVPGNPTAADSIAAENQTDEPAMIYVQDYDFDFTRQGTEDVCGCIETEWDHDQICWDYAAVGSETFHTEESDSGSCENWNYWCNYAITCPVDIYPPTAPGVCVYTDSSGYDETNSAAAPLLWMAEWSETDLRTEFWALPCATTATNESTENNIVTMTLYTGGKAIPQAQTVIQVNVSATAFLSFIDTPFDTIWTFQAVPENEITILAKSPGYDGNLYVALPKGTTMDATPSTPFQRVSFEPCDGGSLVASGTPIAIIANGADLSQNTPTFCVGQRVNFGLASTPSYVTALVHWNLPDKYVNTFEWPLGASINYYATDALLYNISPPDNIGTGCWYVNGTGGTVSATVAFSFANGQTATIPATGAFIIYRPSVSMDQIQEPRFFTITSNLFGGATIKLGTSGASTTGVMAYTVECDTDSNGLAEITQTCQLSYNPDPGGYNFSDWRLDGSVNYSEPQSVIPNTGTVEIGLNDGPQNGAY